MPAVAGAVRYCPQPLVWPSAAAAISPDVGIVVLLCDQAKAAPVKPEIRAAAFLGGDGGRRSDCNHLHTATRRHIRRMDLRGRSGPAAGRDRGAPGPASHDRRPRAGAGRSIRCLHLDVDRGAAAQTGDDIGAGDR